MHEIARKAAALRKSGIDIGAALAAEEDAGFGGRLRRFRNGTIYFHPNAGAHCVRGGIQGMFDRFGAQGFNRRTGRREFGFPTEDEAASDDGSFPEQRFEFGSIHWVGGTGGVFTHGTLRDAWLRTGGVTGNLGYPIASPHRQGSGEVSFFVNGCVLDGVVAGGAAIACSAAWPMIGKPALVKASKPGTVKFSALRASSRRGTSNTAIVRALSDAWTDRLQLRPSGGAKGAAVPLRVRFQENPVRLPFVGRRLSASLHADQPLTDRTLYDLFFVRPDRKLILLSPNCVYARDSWKHFGLMHATDLHASRRTEQFRGRLAASSKNEFVNYNNGIRAMVAEANRLHRAGKLDAILATGDLVDYVHEHDDNEKGSGNFRFLVELLTGRRKTESGKKRAGLRVPIFMSPGNHDYRSRPYELYFTIDIPAWFDKTLKNFSSHNLTQADAVRIQGNRKLKVSTGRAQSMARVDKTLSAYSRTIARQRSYTVRFGDHRVVMIDSRWDAGTLSSWRAIVNTLGFGTDDERNFADGHPNSVGIEKGDNDLLAAALKEAKGAVIVGIHAPPVNTAGNEYPYYFRESLRPHVDRALQQEFFLRQRAWTGAVIDQFGRVREPASWRHADGAHFKSGGRKGVDYGVSKGGIARFLDLCVGVGVPRKVDLVLSGHAHQNVEYRLEKNGDKGHRYFMDFYTETPRTHYATRSRKGNVHIRVRDGADVNGTPVQVNNHRPRFSSKRWLALDTPPYARPLSASRSARAWWRRHAPVLVQTACLGPVDVNDRKPKEPRPAFRGYRLIELGGSAVTSVTYRTVAKGAGR